MKGCDLCSGVARVHCESDDASLCFDCDAKVHGANFLVARHQRVLLCRTCQSHTPWRAEGTRLGPTVSVCGGCIHGKRTKKDNRDLEEEVKGGKIRRNQEDEDDDGDDSDDSDDSDSDGEEDDDEDEEEDGEEQVVPWATEEENGSDAPPLASSSSEEESTMAGGFLKRMRGNALDLSSPPFPTDHLSDQPQRPRPVQTDILNEEEATSDCLRPPKSRRRVEVQFLSAMRRSPAADLLSSISHRSLI